MQSGSLINEKSEYPHFGGSDGVFTHSETRWGTHLATIDCDHSSLTGMPHQRNGEMVADLVS